MNQLIEKLKRSRLSLQFLDLRSGITWSGSSTLDLCLLLSSVMWFRVRGPWDHSIIRLLKNNLVRASTLQVLWVPSLPESFLNSPNPYHALVSLNLEKWMDHSVWSNILEGPAAFLKHLWITLLHFHPFSPRWPPNG